jgi:hypothetical protein
VKLIKGLDLHEFCFVAKIDVDHLGVDLFEFFKLLFSAGKIAGVEERLRLVEEFMKSFRPSLEWVFSRLVFASPTPMEVWSDEASMISSTGLNFLSKPVLCASFMISIRNFASSTRFVSG